MSLTGRRALVTGGGRGIGAAVAQALASAGAEVVITGRTAGVLDEVAGAIGGTAVVADVTDRAAMDAVVEHVGVVDILVNNAGIAESRPLVKTDDELWDRTMEINATAPFRLCRALVPGMMERGWGRVVNIASNAGLTGYQYTAAYCASKHALVGMTRALALDVGASGVTVNAVCPGWVATEMAERAVANIVAKTGRSREKAVAALAGMSAQRRLVDADEVAAAVAYLCGDGARGVHGQTLVIDGGQVLK